MSRAGALRSARCASHRRTGRRNLPLRRQGKGCGHAHEARCGSVFCARRRHATYGSRILVRRLKVWPTWCPAELRSGETVVNLRRVLSTTRPPFSTTSASGRFKAHRRTARGKPQPAVRIVRIGIRGQHGAGGRKDQGGGGRCSAGRTACRRGRSPAFAGRAHFVHLWRPPHGVASRRIPHRKVPL